MSYKVERLVNLTVALLEARRPVTFAELRTKLHAYGHDDAESARRMFERDKDDLRRLGVPVQMRPVDPLDTEVGYLVDRRDYALQAIDLDAGEVAALALALQVTGDQRARLGLAKLAARAPDPDEIDAPSARIAVGTEAVEALAAALLDRQAVAFGYRAASGEESQRTIDPYAVAQRRGHWYVVGRDHDRNDLRAFRLARCTSPPRAVGAPAAFEHPADLDVDALVAGPAEEPSDVDVAVAPALAWEAEQRGGEDVGEVDDGWRTFRFRDSDPGRVVSWVLGLGASARVLSPEPVRERAIAHLERLASGA